MSDMSRRALLRDAAGFGAAGELAVVHHDVIAVPVVVAALALAPQPLDERVPGQG